MIEVTYLQATFTITRMMQYDSGFPCELIVYFKTVIPLGVSVFFFFGVSVFCLRFDTSFV